MYNKVNDKIKESMLNDTFRLIYIVMFIIAIFFVTITNIYTATGTTYGREGVKGAHERYNNSKKRSSKTKEEYATYTVVYKYEQLDGTYIEDVKELNGIVDSEVIPEVLSKDGYITPSLQADKINKDGSTIIEYTYDLEKYDLVVNDFDKLNEGDLSGLYKYGTEITLSAKKIDGYKFVKWSNDEVGSSITINITEPLEIGPIYEELPKEEIPKKNKKVTKKEVIKKENITYKVVFDANGGTLDNNSYKVEKGKVISKLPIPTPPTSDSDLRFAGWYTSRTNGTKVSDGYEPSNNITLYAKYVKSCEAFKNDSWSDIAFNSSNRLDYYAIGCTRTIDLDNSNDSNLVKSATIRVVNNTSPEICNSVSQTSCGFVLAFDDVITKYKMNIDNTDSTWKTSIMRKYLNNELFKSLPKDLRDVISTTNVITNSYIYGNYGEAVINYNKTVDKLYLLDEFEITEFPDDISSIYGTKYKILDYYKNKGVKYISYDNYENNDVIVKKYKDEQSSEWWMRSDFEEIEYVIIDSNGGRYYSAPNVELGVSPAFRIDSKYGNYHTITYVDEFGDVIEVKYIKDGNTVDSLPEIPDKKGKTIDGWYTKKEGGSKVSDGFKPTKDTTIYMRYIDGCKDFETASWETIKNNVVRNEKYYSIGCEKNLKIDYDQDGEVDDMAILRVVNNSTPAECSSSNYSQTACGFVVEFKDIIDTEPMNDKYDSNFGGWKSSTLRKYMNSEIYNTLPEDLRNVIIPTKVISGHGSTEGEQNFATMDKLYLLSTVEVLGMDIDDTVDRTLTRQLDYYKYLLSATDIDPEEYTKSFPWWLRTAVSVNKYDYMYIYNDSFDSTYSEAELGVSPAFRIGNDTSRYYTINLNLNGGKSNITKVKTIVGEPIETLPRPNGPLTMKFEGWYTELDGGIKITDDYVPNSDMTLYARYVEGCSDFQEDEWALIAYNTQKNVSYYPLGCTKNIEVDTNRDGVVDVTTKVRVVNNTMPPECKSSLAMPTACGFVLQFEDIVIQNPMTSPESNPVSENGYSEHRYDIYEMVYDLFDKVYRGLPGSLRDQMLGIRVRPDELCMPYTNLYLPSMKEVYGVSDSVDYEENYTRQLDYYKEIGVTKTNTSGAIKKYNGIASSWWLRSSLTSTDYLYVKEDGTTDSIDIHTELGAAPAFKLRYYEHPF